MINMIYEKTTEEKELHIIRNYIQNEYSTQIINRIPINDHTIDGIVGTENIKKIKEEFKDFDYVGIVTTEHYKEPILYAKKGSDLQTRII